MAFIPQYIERKWALLFRSVVSNSQAIKINSYYCMYDEIVEVYVCIVRNIDQYS